MELKLKIKPFNALTTTELYSLLQIRSEVFVVEQNSVYQDVDGKDSKALHVLGYLGEDLAAYTRLFDRNDYFEAAAIGRVVVSPKHRNKKLGHAIVAASIQAISENFNTSAITISAQKHLKSFYETHGFIQTSETYLEDGIPHIEMKRV